METVSVKTNACTQFRILSILTPCLEINSRSLSRLIITFLYLLDFFMYILLYLLHESNSVQINVSYNETRGNKLIC